MCGGGGGASSQLIGGGGERRVRFALARKAQATRAVLQRRLELPVALDETLLVVVVVLEVPHRRPPVLDEVGLVVRMEQAQAARRHPAQLVVVDAEVIHAEVSELVRVVQLDRLQQPEALFDGLVGRQPFQVFNHASLDKRNQTRQAETIGELH